MSLSRCILPPLRVLSCIETLVGHVMFLKGLIAATFESSEPSHLLRLNLMGVSAPSLCGEPTDSLCIAMHWN